jgi:hypothetical protein
VVDAVRARGLDVEELETLVPAEPLPSDHLGYAVPLRLRAPDMTLLTTLTHFGTANDVTVAELTVEAFLPADEATERAFDSRV